VIARSPLAYARQMRRALATIGAFVAFFAAAPAAGSGSGIRGRVVASPTCPVERVPPDPRCAPRGFAAALRIYRLSDQHTVARLRTPDNGRFRVRLRPGRYGVSARPAAGGSLPRCPRGVKASVRRGYYTSVTIDCDSGIR
jgi:hypothetical protein